MIGFLTICYKQKTVWIELLVRTEVWRMEYTQLDHSFGKWQIL